MRLSKHFTLAEAMKSQTALRKGIDNTPSDKVINTLSATATHVLEPIRRHYGVPFSPNSWYRSPELNKAIGGAEFSQHMKGEAVDIEIPGVPNIELARWVEANIAFDQLILEFWRDDDPTAGWVHVSYRSWGKRSEVLTIGGGITTHGLPK